MKFPDGISGPKISDGDLLFLEFKDSNLTLRVPAIPKNTSAVDEVTSIRDWTNPNTDSWKKFYHGKQTSIVTQFWNYEDEVTHDDIARCFLDFNIAKVDRISATLPFTLNSEAFYNFFLNDLIEEAEENGPETRDGWPSIENNFYLKSVEKPQVNGVQFQEDMDGGQMPYPMPVAFIPLGRNLYLSATLKLCSLHYKDRKNPFSEKTLHQFKLDLFNELLSYIQVDYKPEIVELINALKVSKPAP